MIRREDLAESLKDFLPRQRWFGGKARVIDRVVPTTVEVLRDDWPAVVRVEAVVTDAGGSSERYQILLGLRSTDSELGFLEEHSDSLLGDLPTQIGPAHAYEALRDPELCLLLFTILFPQIEPPRRVRPVTAEQSNTLLIYDDKLVFKIFRALSEEVNLDLEMTEALGRVGFSHVAAPAGIWRRGGTDLGMVQPYLAGAVEGWALALTSLRDMFGSRGDPALSGGDFAAEAHRIGSAMAKLHAALIEAFGKEPGNPAGWAESMKGQLERVSHPGLDKQAASAIFARLGAVSEAGPAMRIHGDMHLGQVMRTDAGWFFLDFGGEPSRPVAERRRPTSPLKDVAGLLRSLHYACRSALHEQEDKSYDLAREWEERNRGAFVDGYLVTANRLGGLLPPDEPTFGLVLKAFELDRCIYEVGYELAHRPEWVNIPIAGIERLY